MNDLTSKSTTNNYAPQFFIQREKGKRFTHGVADAEDAESLLASGEAQLLKKATGSMINLGKQATQRRHFNTATPKRLNSGKKKSFFFGKKEQN